LNKDGGPGPHVPVDKTILLAWEKALEAWERQIAEMVAWERRSHPL